MNYQLIYDRLIIRAQTRQLPCYTETHHIIPRCLGGSNKKANLVELTAREHFLCHWLLVRLYPDHAGLAYAFWNMCNGRNNQHQVRHIPSSRVYEEAKTIFIATHSHRVISNETRNKISEANKGRSSWNKGKTWTEQQQLECSKNSYKPGHIPWTKGKKLSEDHINKRTQSRKNYIVSEETKQKISAATKGKPKPKWTAEQRQKQILAKKGSKKQTYICQHCAKEIGGIGNHKKHENSCKNKK